MHDLKIIEMTGIESIVGGGQADHHFAHAYVVLFGSHN